ncbi:MAG: uracil phosphoribosyltransferase, partial [Gammaproteobacteria bacterium]
MAIQKNTKFPNFYEVHHPLLQHKLSMLRDEKTDTKEFKALVNEITLLMAYEVTKDLPTKMAIVKTPLASCEVPVLTGKKPVILPILRAGIGMVDAFLTLMPSARVAHI